MDNDERAAADAMERRVASLEASVRALTRELEQLRGAKGAAATEPPIAASALPVASTSAAAPPSPPRRRRSDLDLESLIGRYGTLVLATITALAAVGTFLGWAISKGWLGPTQRVALGLLTAVALAAAGFRLRQRERSFGASLVGLALAMLLVCAWAAGPSLELVPPVVAFLLAAVTSVVVALFAHREDDEPLWCVGFSGAAIAPFVTSSGQGNLPLLAAYGAATLVASGYAMNGRQWLVAGRLFLIAAGTYSMALAFGGERQFGPVLGTMLPLVAAFGGVLPWTGGWTRRERLRALGALSVLASLRSAISLAIPMAATTHAALLAAAGLAWIVLVDRTHRVATPPSALTARRLYEGDWLDAAVLPLGFVLGAMIALDGSLRDTGSAMAVASAILMATVARFPQGTLRDAAVFATVLSALVSALFLLRGQRTELTIAITLMAAACFVANRRWRSVSWPILGGVGLAWALLAVVEQLTARPAYEYTPFGTIETLTAAILLACVVVAWRAARHDARLARLLGGGVLVVAFLWAHQEIAFAFSRRVAILLLVTYYAATSVGAVAAGRAKRVPVLRHVGLALAVLAAATALYGAHRLDAIAIRIAADLVAAAFLLAIAWWYRRPGGLRPES